MVEEIVSNIIEAENKAEEIRLNSKKEAKAMVSEAQKNSDALREKHIKDCKAKFLDCKKNAETEADILYNNILSDGEKKAEDLINSAKDLKSKAVQTIVDEIIG